MQAKVKTERQIIRVSGKLRELVTIKDETGKILHKVFSPIMVEFYPRDVMQVVIGSSILAIPVAFTEETWNLGLNLPLFNVLCILLLSVLFIGCFVYYNFYRGQFKAHRFEFLKRTTSIYVISLVMVALILTIIQKAPWGVDNLLAFKRIVLVAFPASMSAAISDMIK